MPHPTPISDAERAELRRLFLAAAGGGWTAQEIPGTYGMVRITTRRGAIVCSCMKLPPAELAAAAVNALPRLFGEIDDLRAKTRGIPVLGTVS